MAWWLLMAVADPIRQKIIGVKVDNANIGEYVKVTNLTNGGKFYEKLQGTDRSVIINPGEDFTWKNGDNIQAEIHGRLNGIVRTTIQSGGVRVAIPASVDTATPGADL